MGRKPPSGFRSRPLSAVILGIMSVAVAVGVAAWSLAPRPSSASGSGGPHLSIAVVPPVEPIPIAGEILEVGTLNDAFDRAALERQPEITQAEYRPPDAYAGESWSEAPALPEPQMSPPPSSDVAVITSTDPLADGSRLFGFDGQAMVSPQTPSATASAGEQAALPSGPATASQSFFQ